MGEQVAAGFIKGKTLISRFYIYSDLVASYIENFIQREKYLIFQDIRG